MERIDACKTRDPLVTSYTITGTTIEAIPRMLAVQTVKPWAVAVCQRAQKQQCGVWLEWMRTHDWGNELIAVSLDDSKFTHEEPV